MARIKTELDDVCYDCKHFKHTPAHLTADPYYSSPEENECDFDFDCPELMDCAYECDICSAECDDRQEESDEEC